MTLLSDRHRTLANAYALRPGHRIPIVAPCGPTLQYPFLDRINDLDKMLASARSWADCLAGQPGNDWPPFIDTFCGVVLVPEAFGCNVTYTAGEDPWTEPLLSDIGQVWSLHPRPLAEAPLIRRLSEWVDVAQRKLGTDLPLWTMDIQSPFSVAARIVEPTEVMMACITEPKAVHHLCSMVTDYTIAMMRGHLAQMEHPGYPGRNFPSISEDIGICIADDTPLIMLGPDMYREFALPYNSRIGEAFGGVHLHCCGDYLHNLDAALETTNLRSIQCHAGPGEFPLPESSDVAHPLNRARGRVTVFVDTNGVARGDRYRDRPRQHYSEYTIPRLAAGDCTGLILQSCGTGDDMPSEEGALQWTRRQMDNARQ